MFTQIFNKNPSIVFVEKGRKRTKFITKKYQDTFLKDIFIQFVKENKTPVKMGERSRFRREQGLLRTMMTIIIIADDLQTFLQQILLQLLCFFYCMWLDWKILRERNVKQIRCHCYRSKDINRTQQDRCNRKHWPNQIITMNRENGKRF